MKKLVCGLLLLLPLLSRSQTVSTVAGIAGAVGSNNGPAATATFNNPHGVAIDRSGNLYIANRYGHNIRKITPAGVVSTFAGGGSPGFTDGTGTAAAFNEPWAVTCDSAGNVYVADTKNYSIRRITPAGNVTTLAGTGTFGVTNGPLLQAQFGFPTGIAVNEAGTIVYVSDRMTHTIRKISGGQVTTLAGTAYLSGNTNGTGSAARFNQPYSIALDTQGNILVADQNNNLIRKVTPAGVVSTYAGTGAMGSVNGPKLNASFNSPWGITCDAYGNAFVGEGNNFLIRKITQDSVLTYAGQDGLAGSQNGPALQSTFNGVSSLVTAVSTNILYLCDPFSQLVRKIVPSATQALVVTTQGGATSFCAGSNITLVALPSGYSSYSFYNGTTLLGTSSTNTLALTAPSTGSYAITCTAVSGSGPVSSNQLNISVSALPSASISVSGPTTICNGDTVTLSANGTGTYLWSNGSTSSSINVTTAGTYTVTVTNPAGCTKASAPVQISLLQAPSATIQSASTTPVCAGDSVLLTASSSASYLWSNGATTQAVYATAPGNYTVLVTNGAGCSAISLPQQVQFHPTTYSTITPAGTVPLVTGNTVTLTANSGQSYLWSNGATTQFITVSVTGNYTVTVTDANGCKSTPATSQVVPLSTANMVSYAGNSTVCKGDTVLLVSAFPSNNQWFVNGNAISGATNPTYPVTQSGSYTLHYTVSPGNIVVSDSIVVTVLALPASVATQSDTVCKGEQAQLLAMPQSGIACKWYSAPSGGTALATGNSFTTPSLMQNQSYWVEQVNTIGCTSDSRTEVVAALHPTPVAGFDFGTATTVTNGYQVNFSNTSTPNAAYLWNFGDPGSPDNTSVEPQPVHVYPATGNYVVILIVANSNGCMDTLTQNIAVRQANNIFIPSGFTPNGDGNNDLFRVRGNNIAYSEMSVYSHWGQRIFYSEKETKGWDGRLNGDIVPNGNYAYVITVMYETGEQETFKGTISVIR